MRIAPKAKRQKVSRTANLRKTFCLALTFSCSQEVKMHILTENVKNCVKNFTEWGGLAGFICYLINYEITNAVIIALVFGILAVCFEVYSSKLR